jgi:hypothetical protein
VLSDEQFIDQLRAELRAGLEVLKPSQELLAAVEELTPENGRLPHGSVERSAGRDQRRWRGRLRGLGAAVPALAAVIVVVVVGAIAFTSFRSHQSSTPARPGSASSAASSDQDLLRTLGILRTAPTATDRALAACIERSPMSPNCVRTVPPTVRIAEHPALAPVGASLIASLRYPRFDLALIRSVATAGSADRITIFPASWRSSPPSAPRTWGVVVNLVLPDNNVDEVDVDPTSVDALRAHGIAVLPAVDQPGRPTGLTVHSGAIIVPDGVVKVTVGTAIPANSSPVLENVTAAVHDNIATVPLRTPTFNNGFGFGDGSVLRVTWLDAHGKVIKHTTTTFAVADIRSSG